MGRGGGGGEGAFVTLIERRGRMRHGTRATTGQGGARMGDGDAVASKEIKEALREVRATIASLEGKSRSIGRGSPGQQSAMLGGGAADTSTEHASSSDKNELTGEDLKCYIEGDAFLRLVNSCCKTLYFGPGTDALLPMDLADSPQAKPFTSGLPYGVRYRYAIGNGNDMVFNGGSRAAIEWMNRYFGFSIKTVEVCLTKHRARSHTCWPALLLFFLTLQIVKSRRQISSCRSHALCEQKYSHSSCVVLLAGDWKQGDGTARLFKETTHVPGRTIPAARRRARGHRQDAPGASSLRRHDGGGPCVAASRLDCPLR